MLIRRTRIWLLGLVVVTLALSTSGLMAARAFVAGDAESVLGAMLSAPVRPQPMAGPQALPGLAVGPQGSIKTGRPPIGSPAAQFEQR